MYEREASESQETAANELSELRTPVETGDGGGEINIPESDRGLDEDVESAGP